MTLLAALLPSMLAAAPAPVAAPQQPEQEIIGYQFTCSAEVPVGSVKLQGALVINEDGTRDSFSAQYHGEEDEIDQLFFLESWPELKRRKIEHHVRLSLLWHIRELRTARSTPLPAFEDGDLRLNVSTLRTLPERVFLVLTNAEYSSTGVVVSSYRWPGRTRSAPFTVPLTELFGFKGKSQKLKWRLLEPPLPVEWHYGAQGLRGDGWIEPEALRVVERPFGQLRELLLAKEADHARACERHPVYYNPDAEI